MWLRSKLLSILGLAAAALDVATALDGDVKALNLRTHTLAKPYLDSAMQSRWFDFGGDTVVRTDSYIRLTSDQPSQSGWLWSRVPLTASNWEIEVEFRIHGKNSLYGDGFAMWVTKNRAMQGPVFGSADNFEGLGIFFDTYKNNRPGIVFPYVMAMFGDGKAVYDKASDGKANELAGCSARGIRQASVATKLRLTYFQEKSLKLELQYRNEDEWTVCFETAEPPTLPAITYLGFSAETGELSDNHEILAVRTKNLYTSNPASDRGTAGNSRGRKPAHGQVSTSPRSWAWFTIKVVVFLSLLGAAYVGYTAWRTGKRLRRF